MLRRFLFTLRNFHWEHVLLNGTLITAAVTTLLLAGCAAPPKYEWVKDGASKFDQENALSECSYQIKLNKIAANEQQELLKLCMQGKGYRYKPVG